MCEHVADHLPHEIRDMSSRFADVLARSLQEVESLEKELAPLAGGGKEVGGVWSDNFSEGTDEILVYFEATLDKLNPAKLDSTCKKLQKARRLVTAIAVGGSVRIWGVGRFTCRSVGLSVCRSVSRSVGRMVGRSDGQTVGRSDGQTVGRSNGHSVGPTLGRMARLSHGRAIGWSHGHAV